MSQKHDRDDNHLSLRSLINDFTNKAGLRSNSIKYVMRHVFFCSSLVKSEATWLHHEKLRIEAK